MTESVPQNTDIKESKKDSENEYCALKINKALISLLGKLGYLVGCHPAYFVVFPIIISALLSSGLFFITYVVDAESLFVPKGAPSVREQDRLRSNFPTNYSDKFSISRINRQEGLVRLVITAKDEGSILRSSLWENIMNADEIVNSVTVQDGEGNELHYEDICARWKGKCTQNTALNLYEDMELYENKSLYINYPIMVFPLVYPQVLGGIQVNESEGIIEDVKAILLVYITNIDTSEDVYLTREWQKKMKEAMLNVSYEDIIVSIFTGRSMEDELKVKVESSLPYFPLTGFIMAITCVLMLWTHDCLRSKPLIGLVGLVSALMSIGSGFGFLIYCGVPYTKVNVVVLFLVLGIGLHDVFVALSTWENTSISDSVPTRLAKTYSDAAVSVTLTSLTNCLAFAAGTIMAPSLFVQNFSLYCCMSIAFAYLWFITFCGGFLAIAGYMEKNRRHSLFFVKVKPLSDSDKKNPLKLLLFRSDLLQDDNSSSEPVNIKSHPISAFFRDTIGDLLLKSYFQGFICLTWLVYMAAAIYGCSILKQGINIHSMVMDGSPLGQFSILQQRYFRSLSYMMQVVLTGNITYSDPETQEEILALITKFEESPYGSEKIFTQSWQRGFSRLLRRRKNLREKVTDEKSFIEVLREEYFRGIHDEKSLDVNFNKDFTRISSSRFLFQVGEVKDIVDDVTMMKTFRKIAADSPLDASVYHILFLNFDQQDLMDDLTMNSVSLAVIFVVVVSLIFMPSPYGGAIIAFSVVSISVGVIGFMTFWGVHLDHWSVGSLSLCIGFSVDFSAHISYVFLSSSSPKVEGKMRDALSGLALPILQGAATTILSLITFTMIPGYGYRTFFKTIFLANVFAIFHSIFLIPLVLSWIGNIPGNANLCCKKRKSITLNGPDANQNESHQKP